MTTQTGLDVNPTSFSSGTTISSSSMNSNFNAIVNAAINNDSGAITTDLNGTMTLPGIVVTALNSNPTPQTVTGTTAGSASLYEFLVGTVKMVALLFNGYQNNTGNEQKVSLPTPFTQRAMAICGNGKNCSVWSGGSQLTNKVNVITSFSSTGGGVTQVSNVPSDSLCEVIQGFDQIGLGINEASQAFAIYLFFGI